MKTLLFVAVAFLFISCTQKPDTAPKKVEVIASDFDWLLGNWERLGEEEGKATFENWEKVSATEYSGIGFTMQQGDTVKQEKMRLIKSDDRWDLKVKTPDEPDFITFRGSGHSSTEFTCENHDIDFPNTIKYWIDGDRLHASVTNSEMEIPFEFIRVK